MLKPGETSRETIGRFGIWSSRLSVSRAQYCRIGCISPNEYCITALMVAAVRRIQTETLLIMTSPSHIREKGKLVLCYGFELLHRSVLL
jgi:hypothetical protein